MAANSKQLSEAYQQCLRLLSRREYAQQELRDKLHRFNDDVIDNCLAQLVTNNYQSDARFTEMFCRSRVGQRYGQRKIRYELQQKGIAESLIKEKLALYTDTWLDNAQALIMKKLPHGEVSTLLNNRNACEKIKRFLIGRGYDYETIDLALNCLIETLNE